MDAVAVPDGPTMLDAALRYARRGWAVFPVHYPANGKCSCGYSSCENVAKHPLTENGLKDASTAEADVLRWWARWPQANIGIATGASNLVVLDIDPRHSGDASLEAVRAAHGEIDTAIVLTGGGGEHYYFRAPANVHVTSRTNALGLQYPGIDVRAAGGYVLAPPSLHASGQRYVPEASGARKLAEVPAWLLDALQQQDRRPISGADDGAVIIAGERNAALARYAGRLRRLGTSVEAMTDALLAMNERQVRPKLDEREIRAIAVSIGRYAPQEVPGDAAIEKPADETLASELVDVSTVPDTDDSDLRRYSLGIENIDRGLGQIRPGEFIVIGARQGHGKTAMAETIAIQNASTHRVVFATLEMRKEDIRDRMIGRVMKCTLEMLETLRKAKHPDYKTGRDLIDGLNMQLYRPTKALLRSSTAVMRAAEQARAEILIVDYTRSLSDWQVGNSGRDSAIVEAFSMWAKESRITTFLLSQLNRDAQGKRPIESQLQDTGRLEQEAEKLILLYRPFVQDKRSDVVCEMIVAKNRRGQPFRGHAHWYGPTVSFFPMTQDEERAAMCCRSRKP